MDLKNIKIEDPFWGHMQELVTDVVIPFQEDVLNDRQPGVEKTGAGISRRVCRDPKNQRRAPAHSGSQSASRHSSGGRARLAAL